MFNKLFDKVNEWSYQRYARFYDEVKASDPKFEEKVSKIYHLIAEEKCDDLRFIAEDSGCTYDECIMKIKYLKNKRLLGDLYIDYVNGIIKECSEADQKLLAKYSTFIYVNHYQIKDMAVKLPEATAFNINDLEEKVFKDLEYLDSKGLINGIILNKVDRKIVYYTIEKHKNDKDTLTINCPNCGAINDVQRNSKTRCAYCKSIIEYKKPE